MGNQDFRVNLLFKKKIVDLSLRKNSSVPALFLFVASFISSLSENDFGNGWSLLFFSLQDSSKQRTVQYTKVETLDDFSRMGIKVECVD